MTQLGPVTPHCVLRGLCHPSPGRRAGRPACSLTLPVQVRKLLKPRWHPVAPQPISLASNLGSCQGRPTLVFPAPNSLIWGFTPPCFGRTVWLIARQCVCFLIPQGLCICYLWNPPPSTQLTHPSFRQPLLQEASAPLPLLPRLAQCPSVGPQPHIIST